MHVHALAPGHTSPVPNQQDVASQVPALTQQPNIRSVTTSNNSDFTVVIVTVGSASGSLKAEPKECLTGKGQVLSKGLRA